MPEQNPTPRPEKGEYKAPTELTEDYVKMIATDFKVTDQYIKNKLNELEDSTKDFLRGNVSKYVSGDFASSIISQLREPVKTQAKMVEQGKQGLDDFQSITSGFIKQRIEELKKKKA